LRCPRRNQPAQQGAQIWPKSGRDSQIVPVLKCDYGVGIIRKGFPESRFSYSAAQIEALNYADLAADRDRLLNLTPPAYLGGFLASEQPKSPRSS
jgi:hypothetical protein